jgi:nucleoside-diphosphate kinase
MQSSTFIMFKPDAVERHLVDTILDIFKQEGFHVVRKKDVLVSKELILKHYEEVIQKVNQDYFPLAIQKTFVGKKVVIVELSKDSLDVVGEVRTLVGATDPVKADSKSIRGRFRDDELSMAMAEKRTLRNLIHASDSIDNTKQEMMLWFGK